MAPVNKAAAAAAAAINAALAQKGIFLPNSAAGASAPAEEGGPAPGLESASWPPAATSPAQSAPQPLYGVPLPTPQTFGGANQAVHAAAIAAAAALGISTGPGAYLYLTRVDCQTILRLTCWVRGTNPSTLERKRARAHQIGMPKQTDTELECGHLSPARRMGGAHAGVA